MKKVIECIRKAGDPMYYNYHAQAKKLIADGHLVNYEIVDAWNNIKPALVLFFNNHRPMPIRSYRWDEYLMILERMKDND